MEGAAFLPRWQGGVGPSAAGSLVAAGSLAAANPLAASAHRRVVPTSVTSGRGWPKGLRPLFLDEIPPRLEDCREKIAAVDRDLGRLCGEKDPSAASTMPVNSPIAGGEPESEASPSARWKAGGGATPGGAEQQEQPEAHADEDLGDSLGKIETDLLTLHKTWQVIDEDRHRAEKQRDCFAYRVKGSKDRAEAMCAQVTALNRRLADMEFEQQDLRRDLGVSGADVETLQPLVETAQRRVNMLSTESHGLHARLYTSQSEVESLRSRVEAEEQNRLVQEEHERLLEEERKERRQAVQQAMDRVREQLEAEVAEERRAAERREHELKLAIATVAQQQKAVEESIKRTTGEGIPEPPRWFRSAMPTLLTRRKRVAHGMMPASAVRDVGALDPEPIAPAGDASDAGQTEQPRSPASTSAPADAYAEGVAAETISDPSPAVEGEAGEEAAEGAEGAESDEAGFSMEPEAAALLEAMMGEGMRTSAPELLFASGLPLAAAVKLGAGTRVGSGFVPASCKIDLRDKSLCLQVLEPTGVVRKIPLGEINSIARPDDSRGTVDVAVREGVGEEGALAEPAKQRLRITAADEDAASALVAAISHPDRILPGSCLVSGRNSTTGSEAAAEPAK